MNKRDRQVVVRLGEVGLDADRLPVALDGLAVVLLAEPDQAQVVVGGGKSARASINARMQAMASSKRPA